MSDLIGMFARDEAHARREKSQAADKAKKSKASADRRSQDKQNATKLGQAQSAANTVAENQGVLGQAKTGRRKLI